MVEIKFKNEGSCLFTFNLLIAYTYVYLRFNIFFIIFYKLITHYCGINIIKYPCSSMDISFLLLSYIIIISNKPTNNKNKHINYK